MSHAASPSGYRTLLYIFAACAVLVLGVGLRCRGIGWGLPVRGILDSPLHPDERSVFSCLASTRISEGDFSVTAVYACGEGQLQYTIWSVGLYAARKVGVIAHTPDESS